MKERCNKEILYIVTCEEAECEYYDNLKDAIHCIDVCVADGERRRNFEVIKGRRVILSKEV